MKINKLAIIVPYRDRKSHLEVFVPYMTEYLKDYDYKIFVIEQSDDKPFNRGKLLNVGARIAIKEGFDYFALHDVDMLPLKGVDYSYPETPIHLVSKINKINLSPKIGFKSNFFPLKVLKWSINLPK